MYIVAIASFSGINSALVHVVFILKKFMILFFNVIINIIYKDTKKIDMANDYFLDELFYYIQSDLFKWMTPLQAVGSFGNISYRKRFGLLNPLKLIVLFI